MKISIYELLGLIKDGKQPKHISIDGAKLFWNGKTYQFETGYCTLSWDCYIEDNQLNYEIEIIEEVEDKEYEYIKEIGMSCSDDLKDEIMRNRYIINALIRNQKYILEKINKERGE